MVLANDKQVEVFVLEHLEMALLLHNMLPCSTEEIESIKGIIILVSLWKSYKVLCRWLWNFILFQVKFDRYLYPNELTQIFFERG